MRVKLLEIYEGYSDYDWENGITHKCYNPGETTDWDEVTDNEFFQLRRWVQDYNRGKTPKLVIVKEPDPTVINIPKAIKECIELAKKEAARKAKMDNAYKKKQQEAAARKAANKSEKEKKLLEKLKAKYENPK